MKARGGVFGLPTACVRQAGSTTALQRLLPVANGGRTSGEGHQADVRTCGGRRPERQLLEVQPTPVAQPHGLAPRTAASVQSDKLKSTLFGTSRLKTPRH